ncbi:MAG: TAXI family TRAP transporter solute-binding subunit [Pirellulales bacterium]
MANNTSSRWHKWFTGGMFVLLVVSLISWVLTRDKLPDPIKIGTAQQGGLYHELGQKLDELLSQRTGHQVQLIETDGTIDNCNQLRSGEIDIAIVQAGAGSMTGISVVAPLHHDLMMVIVRKTLLKPGPDQVKSVADLAGKRVILGLPKSGMRQNSIDLLRHYGVESLVVAEQVHFTELLNEEENYDAAIVTTGINAPNVKQVISSDLFEFIPISANALEQKYGHFQATTIPAEFWPPFPHQTVPTVSTLSLVVVRDDASDLLVSSVLDCLHEHNFRHRFPAKSLHPDDTEFSYVRMHPAVDSYQDPLYGFGWLAGWLETIAAGRELLVALGAGIFLSWDYWRRHKEEVRQRVLEVQKVRLNEFLERTLRVERLQMNETSHERLEGYLDDVTEIKLSALDELSHEELQDHRAFSIFLIQCANLISKIQLKIIFYSGNTE